VEEVPNNFPNGKFSCTRMVKIIVSWISFVSSGPINFFYPPIRYTMLATSPQFFHFDFRDLLVKDERPQVFKSKLMNAAD
jgi:hypothetical protein